jgi:hypothetical protein
MAALFQWSRPVFCAEARPEADRSCKAAFSADNRLKRPQPGQEGTTMDMTLLRCSISPGQFTGEFAVAGTLHDNSGFSLFAQDSDVETPNVPTSTAPVTGWLRVDVIQEQGDLALVRLPQDTLENGRTVTVRREQLRPAKPRQPA